MIGVSVSDILKILDQLPIWKTLKDLPKRVKDLEEKVAALEAKPAAPAAEACPLCGEPMKVTASVPHRSSSTMRRAGIMQRQMTCTACGHTEWRVHDPAGLLGKTS